LASGSIDEPTHTKTAAEIEHPLNPFRMRSGKPSDVQAWAIYTLACIERDKPGVPGVYAEKLSEILADALSDPRPKVREYAFAAAKEMPALSESALLAVLLGTRDPDPKAAAAAFCALATKKGIRLTLYFP
jgi:hypothetical protein